MVRLILTVSQIFFYMDSRIIEFLRSDSCENIATVNVVKSGVSVGEVWGSLSLDERLSFLDQCEDVLHLCYSDVEHWDYATLMGYFDAYRLQRVSGGGGGAIFKEIPHGRLCGGLLSKSKALCCSPNIG